MLGFMVIGGAPISSSLSYSASLSIAAIPAPRAYVTNFDSGTVSVIATSTDRVIATVPVGTNPLSAAVHPRGSYVYVANVGDGEHVNGSISVIGASSKTVVKTISLSDVLPGVFALPLAVAVHPKGTFAYATIVQNNFAFSALGVIDTATNSLRLTSPVGFLPWGVAADPLGDLVYVATSVGEGGALLFIETATNSEVARVLLGMDFMPTAVAVHPKSTFAYVSGEFVNSDGVATGSGLAVVDTFTNQLVTMVPLNTTVRANAVAVDPAGTFVYVTVDTKGSTAGAVVIIDTATNTVVPGVGFPANCPFGVATASILTSTFLYVPSTCDNAAIVFDTASVAGPVGLVGVGLAPMTVGQFIGGPPACGLYCFLHVTSALRLLGG